MSKKIELKTKRQALTWTRDMWAWLAKNPHKNKSDWPGWETRQPCLSACACCEVTDPAENGCAGCPLLALWGGLPSGKDKHFFPCVDNPDSVYLAWADMWEDVSGRPQILAKRISEAAQTELDKL